MLENLDINSLMSGAGGVLAALAAIRARLALLEWRVKVIETDFKEHTKKAAH